MGKRSNFVRRERDWYPTPREAVAPLLPHLAPRTQYIEPCAGNGALIEHLAVAGHSCMFACDVEPLRSDIKKADALTIEWTAAPMFITNPPWSRDVLHPMIERFSRFAPTWLLFDADWAHTRQAAPFMPRLRKIVSVGRVKWIPGSAMSGKDNCAWHLFDTAGEWPTAFFGRGAA